MNGEVEKHEGRGMDEMRGEMAKMLGFFTENQIAVLAGVKLSTLESWRKHGKGPDYVRFGNAYFYSLDTVKEFLKGLQKSDARDHIRRTIASAA